MAQIVQQIIVRFIGPFSIWFLGERPTVKASPNMPLPSELSGERAWQIRKFAKSVRC
jgi:hypothetical protein